MGRTLTEDGRCYRHVIKYIDVNGKEHTNYYGPYDTPGMAKGMGTRRLNARWTVLERYTEISKEWERI